MTTGQILKKEERKEKPLWCSKHQILHLSGTRYWSGRFPNCPEQNNKMWQCEECDKTNPYWKTHCLCETRRSEG